MLYIYGAKSIALGVCHAVQALYPSYKVEGFLVSSLVGNPTRLAELPVIEIGQLVAELPKESVHILIATPENVHKEIAETLEQHQFLQYTCIDSVKEAELIERYYAKIGKFSSLHELSMGREPVQMEVYTAKFYRDVALQGDRQMPSWTIPIQVGAALTDVRVSDVLDNVGEHISTKNVNYCELTAFYWIWKNRLLVGQENLANYYGLFHYRRMLDVTEEDLFRLKENGIDVILPFPMIHEPNVYEHHTRYLKDVDWDAMMLALQELWPEYAQAMPEIFSQPYMYNYNMMIAKPGVIVEYCEWLFPILVRVEELSAPRGWERADRYIGYMGENLLTLYFMYNKDKYKIVHTGRIMLT